MRRTWLSNLGIAVGAGAGGCAIHLLAPGLLRLLPGRILTLPVAILFGPWLGLLAGALGAAPIARAVPA